MKMLITSGGTEEPLDGVRYITNFSSGRTGAGFAEYAASQGNGVVLLHGYHAVLPDTEARGSIGSIGSIKRVRYRTFSDLDTQLQKILKEDPEISTIIHLAAVSDYSPEFIETPDGDYFPAGEQGKLSSGPETMVVHLRRNFKILSRIRGYAQDRELILVGFKLTNTEDTDKKKSAIQEILQNNSCDILVHNDLNDIGTNPEDTRHTAFLYAADGSLVSHSQTKQQLFEQLYTEICRLERRLHA